MKITLIFCFFLPVFLLQSQPLPTNGLEESNPEFIAITNVQIIVSPTQTIEKGTILLKGNRILKVGKDVNIPKDALVKDYSGLTLVPAFVEVATDYGVPKAQAQKHDHRPQLDAKKEGAVYWNEAIQAEVNAKNLFNPDKEKAKHYQAMGFGFGMTHQQNGLIRGSGAAIAFGDHTANEAIINAQQAGFLSFQKGVSKQTYPSSQMGGIALIRQALYDAQYYSDNHKTLQTNITLSALNQIIKTPLFFDLQEHLEINRAEKIAKEFQLKAFYIGSGDEYQAIKIFPENFSGVFIPVKYPEAYDVQDPYVARQIPLKDLKHWELAPSNAAFLRENDIPIGITSKGVEKPDEFWKNLRLALGRGLSREDALTALTVFPAKCLEISDIGTLEEGKLASFSVFYGDPFIYEDAQLLAFWSLGKENIHKELPGADMRGKFNLTFAGENIYGLKIEGTTLSPAAKVNFTPSKNENDNWKKAKINIIRNNINISFNGEYNGTQGAFNLNGQFNEKLGVMEGQGQLPDGSWVKWAAVKNEKFKEAETRKTIAIEKKSIELIWYPNMAYGFNELPKAKNYAIRNATIWTNEEDGIIREGNILFQNGKIQFVGKSNFLIPAGTIEIDGKGLHVTSGIIDEHSHIAISKGVNEAGQSNSAEVSIADVVRNNDINIYRQLSGGVTAAQLLHGSANAIGGRSALVKLKWGYSPEEMLIPNAPKFIKFALGENVKQSNWGDFQTIRFPQTRMGVEQTFYQEFRRAKAYGEAWEKYRDASNKSKRKEELKAPAKDLALEALYEIIQKERFISCHSYVQSEINMLMHVADSFGFTVNTFTHILEGYKLADKMAKHGAGGSTFSDWWGYKMEVNDAIPHNASLMHQQGVLVAINSDDAEMGRRLNQEAAKVIKYGGASEEEAWKMVTLNPAKLLHLDDRMGSLKAGKDADVVIWTANPLTQETKVVSVFVDGTLLYDFKEDERKRRQNKLEKTRLINLMLADNEKGNPKKPFVKKEEPHWHCDTIGEQGHETHTHGGE